jgi:hypothetical protein
MLGQVHGRSDNANDGTSELRAHFLSCQIGRAEPAAWKSWIGFGKADGVAQAPTVITNPLAAAFAHAPQLDEVQHGGLNAVGDLLILDGGFDLLFALQPFEMAMPKFACSGTLQ